MTDLIATLLIWAFPVLAAITLHEAAHGYMAWRFGDPTAKRVGRLSLNPLKHVDPVGTLLVPGLALLLSWGMASTAMIFGWAKPVPVQVSRLRRAREAIFWIAAAGPLANLVQALIWALFYKLAFALGGAEGVWALAARMADAGMHINVLLMVINLLPILPLDGGRMLSSVLPLHWAELFQRIEPYGLIIVLLLWVANLLNVLIWPLYLWVRQGVLGWAGT